MSAFLVVSRRAVEGLLQKIMSQSGVECSDNGMFYPDGRPLYLYKLGAETFDLCGQFLRKALSEYNGLSDYYTSSKRPKWLSGLLVLYGAHWFRRESRSTTQRWVSLNVLPEDFDTFERGRMIKDGLNFWRLKVYHSGYGKQWLHTLALNGGIPARVIANQDNNWFTEFFKKIVSDPRSVGDETGLGYEAIVNEHLEILTERFRQPEIIEQSVRLLNCVMKWRRNSPGELTVENSVVWLENSHPSWRDEIPLHVAEDDKGVKDLVKQLLTIQTVKLTKGLSVSRYINLLRKDGDILGWSEGVEIGLEGEGDLSDFGMTSQMLDSRFDIHLVNDTTTLHSGRIGVAFAKTGKSGASDKIICSSTATSKKFDGFRLNQAVQVQLRNSVHGRIEMVWPGGEAVYSEIIVFHRTGSDRAKMIGTGSVNSRHETLLVLAPSDAKLRTDDLGEIEKITQDLNWSLWQVSGRVTINYETRNYRVQTHQNGEENNSISPVKVWFDSFRIISRHRIMCSSPIRYDCLRNDQIVNLSGDFVDLGQRRKGVARDWRHEQGRLTLHWKDENGFHLDKVAIRAIPSTFKVSIKHLQRSPEQGANLHVSWSGLSDWKLSFKPNYVDETASVFDGVGGDEKLTTGMISEFPITLIDPQGRSTDCLLDIDIETPAIIHQGKISSAKRVTISISDLNQYSLALPEKTRIWFELKSSIRPYMIISVLKGQTNLTEFRDIFEMLLASSKERGPIVALSTMGGGVLAHVKRPDVSLSFNDGQLSNPDTLPGQPILRQLLDMTREYAAQQIDNNHYKIPESIEGACLAYMRDKNSVTSRPIVVKGAKDVLVTQSALNKCILIEDEKTRHARLVQHLRDVEGPEWGQSIDMLIKTIVSLRGLSPRSLDCLRVLPECPEALCGMLLKAPARARVKLLTLENQLPFLWMGLPFDTWKRVQGIRFKEALELLQNMPGIENGAETAINGIKKTFNEISETTVWFKGISQAEPIAEHGNFQNLIGQHIDKWDNTFRIQLDDLLFENSILSASKVFSDLAYTRTPTLLAPLALAALCHKRIVFSSEQLALIRNALAIDPDYVKIGFVHAMREVYIWEPS